MAAELSEQEEHLYEELRKELLWDELSETDKTALALAAVAMRNRQVVTFGLTVSLALVVGWGLTRDPLLLAGALVVGMLIGLALWLFR